MAHDIVATRDCGFQIIGRASPTGVSYAFAARLTQAGGVVWSKVYHPAASGIAFGYSVVQAEANDDLILGCDFGAGGVNGARFILRTDSAGTPLWGARLSGDASVVPLGQGGNYGFESVSVFEMASGAIASVSRIRNTNGVARAGLLALLQSNGALVFSKRYVPGGGSAAALDFAQVREARDPDATKQMLVLGTVLFSTDFYGMFAMRTDSDGNVIWARTYLHPSGTPNLLGTGFTLAPNGDILFAAVRETKPIAPNSNRNAVVGRIDAATGDPVWAATFDGFRPGFNSVTTDSLDNMLVAGYIGNNFDTAEAAVRFTQTGAFLDGRSYGDQLPNARAAADAIIALPAPGGYAMVGRTQEVAPATFASLIRTDVNLMSGCHEAKFSPNIESLEMVVRTPALTTLDDAAYLSEMPIAESFTSAPTYRCFKPACAGDLNGDSLVDDADFVLFAGAYDILVCPTDPELPCCPADLNGDGFVDDADFVLFANAYDQLLCP